MAGLWALMIAAFMGGAIYLAEYQSHVLLPPRQDTLSEAQANQFVAYRNACVNYAIANRTFNGSIPNSSLALPPGYAPQIGAQNTVTSTGGVSTVYVWASLQPGSSYTVIKNMKGDESYGVVDSGQWTSPVYGILGSAPAYVPNGDILSVVQIGG